MRPLHVIKKEIEDVEKKYNEKIKYLHREIKEIQNNCPHPKPFLRVDHRDKQHHRIGLELYDYSITEVECVLCGKKRYSDRYTKKKHNSYSDWRPDPFELLCG